MGLSLWKNLQLQWWIHWRDRAKIAAPTSTSAPAQPDTLSWSEAQAIARAAHHHQVAMTQVQRVRDTYYQRRGHW